jgi:hypothetical protein
MFDACAAMINLVLARAVYRDWSCRYHVAADVPRPAVVFLRDNGADVCAISRTNIPASACSSVFRK